MSLVCEDMDKATVNRKIIYFLSSDVKDIHDCLEISVYDEDKRGAPDLLGKVAIPLLQVSFQQPLLPLETTVTSDHVNDLFLS